MDASGSVTSTNFDKMRDFVVKFSQKYDIGKDETRFGIIRYSIPANVEFKFDDSRYWTASALEARIKQVVYDDGKNYLNLNNFILTLPLRA